MSHSTDFSQEDVPEWMSGLTPDQRTRLTRLLDEYLSKLEQGERLSLSELSIDNEDLVQPLRLYIDQIDRLYGGAKSSLGTEQVEFDAFGITSDGESHRLGDFLLIREIGRGGMGIVYEAIQESLNRKVALKLLPMPAMFSRNQVARFQNEAQATAILQHPHIVPVYAIGVEKGIHFYAMPLIEGQSLDEIISQIRYVAPPGMATKWLLQKLASPSGLTALLSIGADAADALQAAHEVGIVHRDIKPSNLLLESSGKIFVADFGLARMESDKSLTRTGELIGTVRYMSPEQASGKHALVDHRTDIYSLGVTLYELITLHPAIVGEDSPTLLQAIEKQEPIPLRKFRKDLPRDLETVVAKAMSKRREDRYFSAREFAEDLRSVVAGKPTVARPLTLAMRVAKWTAQNRGYFVAASILLAVATMVIAWQVKVEREKFATALLSMQKFSRTLDQIGTEADKLEGTPGTEDFRRIFSERSLVYYRDFIAETKGNPAFRKMFAEVSHRQARLLHRLQYPDDSIPLFEESRSTFRKLLSESPADFELRRSYARCLNDFGLAVADQGKLDEGIEWIEQAIQNQRELIRREVEYPAGETTTRLDLVKSLNDLGWLQERFAEVERGRESFRNAIDVANEILESNATQEDKEQANFLSANAKHNLAQSFDSTDPEKATELYAEVIANRSHSRNRRGPNLGVAAVELNNYASALFRSGKRNEAIEKSQAAIAIQRDLVKMYPDDLDLSYLLASSLNNLGWMWLQTKDLEHSIEMFREAIEIHRGLLVLTPNNIRFESDLGGSFNNLAMAQEQVGKPLEASQSYVEANKHQKRALDAAPGEQQYRDFLNKQYVNFSRLQRGQKQWQEAAKLAVLRRDLYPNDPAKLFSIAGDLAEIAQEAFKNRAENREVQAIAEDANQTLRMAKNLGFRVESSIIEAEPFSILLRFSTIEELLP